MCKAWNQNFRRALQLQRQVLSITRIGWSQNLGECCVRIWGCILIQLYLLKNWRHRITVLRWKFADYFLVHVSEETHFWLNISVNRWNRHCCCENNPELWTEVKFLVRFMVSLSVIKPNIFRNENTPVTVNCHRHVVPTIWRYVVYS